MTYEETKERLEGLFETFVYLPKSHQEPHYFDFGLQSKHLEGETWVSKIPLAKLQQLSELLGTSDITVEIYERGDTDIVIACRELPTPKESEPG